MYKNGKEIICSILNIYVFSFTKIKYNFKSSVCNVHLLSFVAFSIQKFVFLTSPFITILLKINLKIYSAVLISPSCLRYLMWVSNSPCPHTPLGILEIPTVYLHVILFLISLQFTSLFPFPVHYHYSSITNANQNMVTSVLDYYITARI